MVYLLCVLSRALLGNVYPLVHLYWTYTCAVVLRKVVVGRSHPIFLKCDANMARLLCPITFGHTICRCPGMNFESTS